MQGEHTGRAVEVTALFEDAIVEVRHLQTVPPARGARWQALVAGGAALYAAALGTFAWAGHAQRVPVAADALVALALIAGAWLAARGLERRADGRRKHTVDVPGALIGSSGDQPLVRAQEHGFELVLAPGLTGEATLGTATLTLAELAAGGKQVWPLPPEARVRVQAGEATWLISTVPAPRREVGAAPYDWKREGYTLATAATALLALAGIFSVPPDPRALALDDLFAGGRYPAFLLKPPQEEEQKLPSWLQKAADASGGNPGGAAQGKNGKMGKENAPRQPKRYAIAGHSTDVRFAKELALKQALNTGIVGEMRRLQGSHIAAIWATDDSAIGHDAENVMGNLIGTEVGEADGIPGGLGTKGDGTGGGGHNQTIGMGDLPTIGNDGRNHGPGGYGARAGALHDRKPKTIIDAVPGTAHVKGGLDKEIVRRVIRQHLNEVKFCYEKELLKNDALLGRVVTSFTITGTGKVAASVTESSTLGNRVVESCIADAVKRWEFPQPDGGGIVVVSYPFVLKATAN